VSDVNAPALRVDWRENEGARAGALRPLPTDAHIADVVRRRLAEDVLVGAQVPVVHVAEGLVALSGNVMDFRAEKAAVKDADRVRGVGQVADRMTVLPAVRESDATIEEQAQRSVDDDQAAPDAHDVQISTASAKVTLRGAVASPQEKALIEQDVEEVPGAVAVENDLQVAGYGQETHVVAPASMRERVNEAIFWDPRIGSDRVSVAVVPNGDVTLSGVVDSRGESRFAAEDATHAGAASVINHIGVAGAPVPPRPPQGSPAP
jgi:osmotically-inducible protein OsmY